MHPTISGHISQPYIRVLWYKRVTPEIKKYSTVGENIIATSKIRYNYGAIQSCIFQILLFIAPKDDSKNITVTFR